MQEKDWDIFVVVEGKKNNAKQIQFNKVVEAFLNKIFTFKL